MLGLRDIILPTVSTLMICSSLWSQRALAESLDASGEQQFDLMASISQGPPMSANAAAERAVHTAPSLAEAEALTHAAEAAVDSTRDQLLPRLDLLARYVHVDGFPVGKIATGGTPEQQAAGRSLAQQVSDPAARALWLASFDQAQAGVRIKIPKEQVGLSARLSWPVSDVILAVLPALEASHAAVHARRAQRLAREGRVRLSAREGFYHLARARGGLAVAQRALEQALSQKEHIDAAVQAGVRPPAEGSSASARAAGAARAVSSAETGVDIATAALRTLLRDGVGAPYAISEPLLVEAPGAEMPPVETLVATAQQRRAELKAAREGINARKQALRATDAAAYPHLGVYVGADYARPNRYIIPPNTSMQPSWEAGAQLNYAPNDTLAARRKNREASAQIAALEAELEQLTLGVALEVQQSRSVLVHASRSIEAARASERSAHDAYARRAAELRAGEVTLADLFSAESEVNAARLLLLDAAIDERLARARMAYALGE